MEVAITRFSPSGTVPFTITQSPDSRPRYSLRSTCERSTVTDKLAGGATTILSPAIQVTFPSTVTGRSWAVVTATNVGTITSVRAAPTIDPNWRRCMAHSMLGWYRARAPLRTPGHRVPGRDGRLSGAG